MKLRPDGRPKARIEMLPLIDIVFLLLVFFIYAMLSMAVHRGASVHLPQSSTATVEKEKLLSVTIGATGDIFVDKMPVALDDLEMLLKQRVAGEKEPGVLLFADGDLAYKNLFQVLDRIRKAGIENVSMQAEKKAADE